MKREHDGSWQAGNTAAASQDGRTARALRRADAPGSNYVGEGLADAARFLSELGEQPARPFGQWVAGILFEKVLEPPPGIRNATGVGQNFR